MENKWTKLKAMLAQVREATDLEKAFRDMGFSSERAEALATNRAVRGARSLVGKDE